MFSIESIINGIITFLKRFFYTFYSICFRPGKFIVQVHEKKLDNYLQSSSYFVISVLFFFVAYSHSGDLVRDLQKELVEVSTTKQIFYALVVSSVLYCFFFVLGKLLWLSDESLTVFGKLSLYWWGMALNLALVFLLILEFGFHLRTHHFYFRYLLPALLVLEHVFIFLQTVISISSYYKFKSKVWFKFLLIPVFSTSAMISTVVLLKGVTDIFEEKEKAKPDIIVFNDKISSATLNIKAIKKSDSVTLRLQLYAMNNSGVRLYINQNDMLYLYETPAEDFDNDGRRIHASYPPRPNKNNKELFFAFSYEKDSDDNHLFTLDPGAIDPVNLILIMDTLQFNQINKIVETRKQLSEELDFSPPTHQAKTTVLVITATYFTAKSPGYYLNLDQKIRGIKLNVESK